MKPNVKNFDLRIDATAMCMGDDRALFYARMLRYEIFESAEEMIAYFRPALGSPLEKVINSL